MKREYRYIRKKEVWYYVDVFCVVTVENPLFVGFNVDEVVNWLAVERIKVDSCVFVVLCIVGTLNVEKIIVLCVFWDVNLVVDEKEIDDKGENAPETLGKILDVDSPEFGHIVDDTTDVCERGKTVEVVA